MRFKIKSIILIALSIFMLSSCSTTTDYARYTDSLSGLEHKQDKTLNVVPNLSRLKTDVAPGYRYSLYHPSDKKLQGRFRSDFRGILRLPYGVRVNTSGKKFSTVKKEVLSAYYKFFRKGVEGVTFKINSATRWIEVRGLVTNPGKYLIRHDTALDSVLAKAGGVKGDISTEYYQGVISQRNESYTVVLNDFFNNSKLSKKITWLGGDTIFVKKADSLSSGRAEVPFVTLLGGVGKPGKILYQKDASLYYFIEKAGGLTTGLGYDECFVFRNK
ncbi:SLBB domain-containing protein, partial [Halobacteriovorax sp.]|uniref:SLBB domain-containing protein n=1 Tax=Halobacteriovorax sp. TaxID=2020862 RepID=UPI00356604D2